MAEDYPQYVDLTTQQARRLGRILDRHNEPGAVAIQRRADGKLLVTNSWSGQQWRIGVRGGGS